MIPLLLLQLFLPLALVVWAVVWPPRSLLVVALQLLTNFVVTVALIIAGVWILLPWWVAWAFGALFAVAGARVVLRLRPLSVFPRSLRGWAAGLILAGLLAYSGSVADTALVGRQRPQSLVSLAFPLTGGTFLVVNGGATPAVNAHRVTAEPEHRGYRAYRGQSDGVDIVQFNSWGGTWSGDPRRPQDHAIYGAEVRAPCPGTVLAAVDGVPDTPVGVPDRTHMAGNHVRIRCGEFEVLMGHLAPGSVRAGIGSNVTTQEVIGRVGNTGNTDARR